MADYKIWHILLVVGILTAATSLIISELTSPSTGLQFFDIAATTFLSTALVVLYFQQKQVLKSQEELKRAELSGDLYVNDYTLQGKDLQVSLSNLSGSEISKLQLRTEIFPKEINGKTIKVSKKDLIRADEYETQFGRPTGLAPREHNVNFTVTPSVYYIKEDGGEMLPELTFFITELRNWGIEEVQCRIWVEGTDQLGQTVKSKVLRWDKTLRINPNKPEHEEPTLEEIFKPIASATIDDEKSEF